MEEENRHKTFPTIPMKKRGKQEELRLIKTEIRNEHRIQKERIKKGKEAQMKIIKMYQSCKWRVEWRCKKDKQQEDKLRTAKRDYQKGRQKTSKCKQEGRTRQICKQKEGKGRTQ